MTSQEKWDKLLAAVKWLLGWLAVIAVFLLANPDPAFVLPPIVKVALGAFLAFAAYVNPATLVRAASPGLTARANAESGYVPPPGGD